MTGVPEVDREGWRVTWRGAAVRLTATQFRVVERLCRHPGQVVTHAAIAALNPAHKPNHDAPANVRHTVKRIRRRFEAVDPGFDRIATLYGDGYAWRRA